MPRHNPFPPSVGTPSTENSAGSVINAALPALLFGAHRIGESLAALGLCCAESFGGAAAETFGLAADRTFPVWT